MAEPLAAKKYKFVTIEPNSEHEGRPYYNVVNNKSDQSLGILLWYPPWRQYVFEAEPAAVFNNACLKDIVDFLNAANRRERGHA